MNNYDKIVAAITEKYIGEEKEILIEELDRLYDDELFLDALNSNGVDNWEWYDEAVEDYVKMERRIW